MTPVSARLCPFAGCPRPIVVASQRELESGEPLWRCAAGHRGPLVVGPIIEPDRVAG